MRKLVIAAALVALAQPVMAERISGGGQVLNQVRAKYGLKPVRFSKKLQAAAEAHGREMVNQGYFSHTGANGSTVGRRVDRVGYGYCYVVENLAMTRQDVWHVMNMWLNSDYHRDNMLSRKVREYGFAKVGERHWIMVMGKPGC